MSRTDDIRQNMDSLNNRDFEASVSNFAENLRFHAPGLGLDTESRDDALANIQSFVESADVRYEVVDIVEHDPFAVVFAHSTGTFDGQRMGWDICQVLRYEGDKIAETWVVRGGEPQPVTSE
jgi:hypothetical protein